MGKVWEWVEEKLPRVNEGLADPKIPKAIGLPLRQSVS